MGELSLEMGEWPPESPLTREWGRGGRSGSEEQRLHRGRGGGSDTAPHRPPREGHLLTCSLPPFWPLLLSTPAPPNVLPAAG